MSNTHNTGRERKRNEALASKIFSKNRRQSAPSKLKPSSAGASLASRVGVRKVSWAPFPPSKQARNLQHRNRQYLTRLFLFFFLQQQIPQRAISFGRRASVPSGNVNGEWTHDLHNSFSSKPASKKAAGGLGARITQPGVNKASPVAAGGSTSKKAAKRHAKLAAAVGDAMDTDSDQVNIVHPPPPPPAAARGLTIRGLAGPFAVLGQNFAPGTTPADVESAMTPIGGEMISCNVVKTQPFLIMEMVFASREGGERVIEMFNNKTVSKRKTTTRQQKRGNVFFLFWGLICWDFMVSGRRQSHQDIPQNRRLSTTHNSSSSSSYQEQQCGIKRRTGKCTDWTPLS
jgi:hypothetical protein